MAWPGLFQLSRLTQGDPTVAIGLELDIIAAVIIGGASLNGGVGSVLGSMIGALIMSILRNGSHQMGWPDLLPGDHHRAGDHCRRIPRPVAAKPERRLKDGANCYWLMLVAYWVISESEKDDR